MPAAAVPIALTMMSSITQSQAQRKAGDLAETAGRLAKTQADANAKILDELAILDAEEERRTTRQLIASQRAAFARAGVVPGTGSALDVLLDTTIEGEVAALRRRFGLESEAFVERIRGLQADFQGQAAGVAANNAANATLLRGGAQALSFASQSGAFNAFSDDSLNSSSAPLGGSSGGGFILRRGREPFGPAKSSAFVIRR